MSRFGCATSGIHRFNNAGAAQGIDGSGGGCPELLSNQTTLVHIIFTLSLNEAPPCDGPQISLESQIFALILRALQFPLYRSRSKRSASFGTETADHRLNSS